LNFNAEGPCCGGVDDCCTKDDSFYKNGKVKGSRLFVIHMLKGLDVVVLMIASQETIF
jgi:hypothetical protein